MLKVLFFLYDNAMGLLLSLFSWFVPKRKGLVLLSSGEGILFKDNPKYIFLELLKPQSGFDAYWLTGNRILFRQMCQEGYPTILLRSWKNWLYALRAEFIISDDTLNPILYDSFFWPYGRFKNLLTWHGTGFKKIGLLGDKYYRKGDPFRKLKLFIQKERYRKYHGIIASSEYDCKRKLNCFQNKNIFITGLPRNEVFFNSNLNGRIRKQFGLEGYSKVITYAPTYRENLFVQPFTENFFAALQLWLENNDSVFVIKKHGLDKDFVPPVKYKNIIDLTCKVEDVQDLLLATDLLVTDYSSIATDFLLTRKPIIFYVYDYSRYIKNSRSFCCDFKKSLPGPFLQKEGELLKYLNDLSWFHKKSYKRRYMESCNYFHEYADNKGASRFIDIILKSSA